MWFRNKWYLSDGHAICLVIAGSPSLRLPTAVNLEGDRRKKRRVTPCQWCQLYSRKFKSSAAAFSRIKNLKDGWTAELYWPSTPLKGFDGANCVAPTLPTNPSTGHRCGWRQAAKTKRSYKITWLCFPIFSYYCLYFILLTLLPFMHTPKTLHAAPLHWRKRASMLNINVWCGAWSKIKTLSGKMTPHHVTEWIDDRPNCSIFPKGMRRLVPAQSGACVCVCGKVECLVFQCFLPSPLKSHVELQAWQGKPYCQYTFEAWNWRFWGLENRITPIATSPILSRIPKNDIRLVNTTSTNVIYCCSVC